MKNKRFLSRSVAKLSPSAQWSYALRMLGRLQGMLCVQRCFSASLVILIATILLSGPACAQTVSTGALIGITLYPSGAVLPGVSIQLSNPETSSARSVRQIVCHDCSRRRIFSRKNVRHSCSVCPPG